MSEMMMKRVLLSCLGALGLSLAACGPADPDAALGLEAGHAEEAAHLESGPHGGRLLHSGDFELELAIWERGIPPEFRAWTYSAGRPLPPVDVSLEVALTRLGGRVERFRFVPRDGFLKGEGVVAEPHSFEVSIEATYEGTSHAWRYESFEGRTRIDPDAARALGVRTEVAGAARLSEAVTVYGRIRANPELVHRVRARFDGVVRQVDVQVGSRVQKGDRVATVESDESLNSYSLFAPISGVVTQRDVNPGEHTDGRLLLTITDTSTVWADLSIFPGDRARVRVGSPVTVVPAVAGSPIAGVVSMLEVLAGRDQAVVARVVLENLEGRLLPGTFVEAEVIVGEHEVPLAVKKEALQTLRDASVVFAQVGDIYEVRMLQLGRADRDHAEVLEGLEPGAQYVVENSHLIKADIEKSGAAHDH